MGLLKQRQHSAWQWIAGLMQQGHLQIGQAKTCRPSLYTDGIMIKSRMFIALLGDSLVFRVYQTKTRAFASSHTSVYSKGGQCQSPS